MALCYSEGCWHDGGVRRRGRLLHETECGWTCAGMSSRTERRQLLLPLRHRDSRARLSKLRRHRGNENSTEQSALFVCSSQACVHGVKAVRACGLSSAVGWLSWEGMLLLALLVLLLALLALLVAAAQARTCMAVGWGRVGLLAVMRLWRLLEVAPSAICALVISLVSTASDVERQLQTRNAEWGRVAHWSVQRCDWGNLVVAAG